MDTYLQQLNIDLQNQNSQKQMMVGKDYGNINDLGNSLHKYTNTNLKNEIVKKLYDLVNRVDAIKIYNYLFNNNLIDVFLDCYDNLIDISSYHDITSQELINYVINYSKNSADMLDYLKDELEDLLEVKVSKTDVRILKELTDDTSLKNKLTKIEQTIPEDVNNIKNPEIVQNLIDDLESLPYRNENNENVILADINKYYDKVVKPKGVSFQAPDPIPMPKGSLDDTEIQEVDGPEKSIPNVFSLIRERRTKQQIQEARDMEKYDKPKRKYTKKSQLKQFIELNTFSK